MFMLNVLFFTQTFIALFSVSGCTDYFAKTEQEAFEMGRSSVAAFNFDPVPVRTDSEEPLFDPEELLGIIPTDENELLDIYQVHHCFSPDISFFAVRCCLRIVLARVDEPCIS
jgi:acetyl-CoA carboxylase carboxyltransferase component